MEFLRTSIFHLDFVFNKPTRWEETIPRDWEHVRHSWDGSTSGRIDEFLLEGRTLVGHVFVAGAAVGDIGADLLTVRAGLPQAWLALFVAFSASGGELGVHFDLVMRLAVGALLSDVPLRLRLFLFPRCGPRALLDILVLGLALQGGRVALRALVSGGPSPRPAAPLPVQRADGRVRTGGHEDAVGVQLIQGGPVDEDLVAVGQALTPSESHWVGRVGHGIFHSHEALLVGVLQLLLVKDGVHLHPEQDQRHADFSGVIFDFAGGTQTCPCVGGVCAHVTWLCFACESALVAVQPFPWAQRGGSHTLQTGTDSR